MARLNTQPVIAGVAIGAVSAIALVLLPTTAMESIIARTHLADVIAAAQPPLGTKARLLVALIPFLLLSGIGLALGFILGGRKSKDEYGDYGAYADYGADEPADHADPFAVSADVPIMAGTYEAPANEAAVVEMAAPELAPPPPAPVLQPAAALDGATARDLAEIADAVVRLDARLDAIEAKLGAEPKAARATDISKRLAKIAKSLDEAG